MAAIDKETLLRAVRAHLESMLHALEAAARETAEGATHEESRQENPKDTRGLEATYLARGQAQRVVEMQEATARMRALELRSFAGGEAIAMSAVVRVERDGEPQCYFLVPSGGGERVTIGGVDIQLITPTTPVGRALVGKVEGDAFELTLGGRAREFEILDVS